MKVLANFVRFVGQVSSLGLSTIPLINKIRRLKSYFFAGFIKKSFGKVGKNLFIEGPFYICGADHIKIGDDFSSFARLRLEAFAEHLGQAFHPEICIGNGVSINYDCHIGCIEKISIGNGVLIASNVFITDHFHGTIAALDAEYPPAERVLTSKGPVIIGDNVWIGEGACIMPNVTIGAHCIIGANAVVTKSFPENCVIGGIPARVIKKLKE